MSDWPRTGFAFFVAFVVLGVAGLAGELVIVLTGRAAWYSALAASAYIALFLGLVLYAIVRHEGR